MYSQGKQHFAIISKKHIENTPYFIQRSVFGGGNFGMGKAVMAMVVMLLLSCS